MDQAKILNDRQIPKRSSKPSKAFNECVSMLFDEIQLAVVWERPSILLAVHQSKIGQEKAAMVLEKKMMEIQRKVIRVNPGRDGMDILNLMAQTPNSNEVVFFIDGLGSHTEAYHALNLYRELLVDCRIKAVFWLTDIEATKLPRLAPDFWAFRHRVVEFASNRGSRKRALPAGILIWGMDNPLSEIDLLEERISVQEKTLNGFPWTTETMIIHAGMVEVLAKLYWLKGESQKVMDLLRGELGQVRRFDVNEIKASLLNGLAVTCYDLDEFREALGHIDEALALRPNHDILWANRGGILLALGRNNDSIRSVKKAMRIDPKSFRMWTLLGYIYLSMGRHDEALSAFGRAVQLNTDDIRVRFAMAICHSRNGNVGECKEILRMVDSNIVSNSLYFSLCWDGLTQNIEFAMEQLQSAINTGRIPPVSVRRDPSLNFIFDIEKLELSAKNWNRSSTPCD